MEARSRRIRNLSLLGLLVLLSVLLLGQAAPSKILEGQELILTDGNGLRRVVISAKVDGEPVIALLDIEGHVRAGMRLRDGAPGMFLNNSDGREAMRMALGSAGPEVFLYDDNQVARTGFAVQNNVPGLFLRDGNQKERLNITVQDGGPVIFLKDTQEQPRLQLAVTDRPMILFSDDQAQIRMNLLVDQRGNPSMNMRDAATNAQARFGITESEPEIVLIEKGGDKIYERP
jgi:hypothetical protein